MPGTKVGRSDREAGLRQILLDNFTLQGSYGFLHGHNGVLREDCPQILLESVVLYDRIHVPSDVLERNQSSQWVARQFRDVIIGRSMRLTPDLHHHVVDMRVLARYRSLLKDQNPFQKFEPGEAYLIEQEGHPKNMSPPDWMGRGLGRYSFSERHLYYSWFVSARKSCERTRRRPAWRSLAATPVAVLLIGGFAVRRWLAPGAEVLGAGVPGQEPG